MVKRNALTEENLDLVTGGLMEQYDKAFRDLQEEIGAIIKQRRTDVMRDIFNKHVVKVGDDGALVKDDRCFGRIKGLIGLISI